MMTRRPPPLAERLFTWSLGLADREAVLGDLQEEFVALADASGAGAARRWYWAQTLMSVGPNVVRRIQGERLGRRMNESDSDRLMRQSVRTFSLWVIGLIFAMVAFAWVEGSDLFPLFFFAPTLFVGVFLLLRSFVPIRMVDSSKVVARPLRNLFLPFALICSFSILSFPPDRHLLAWKALRAMALIGWAIVLWPERYWPFNRSRRPPSR